MRLPRLKRWLIVLSGKAMNAVARSLNFPECKVSNSVITQVQHLKCRKEPDKPSQNIKVMGKQ